MILYRENWLDSPWGGGIDTWVRVGYNSTVASGHNERQELVPQSLVH